MKTNNFFLPASMALCAMILFAQCKEATTSTPAPATAASTETATATTGELNPAIPIAYVNIDTLLQNYNYTKDLNEALLRKQENARASINEKGRKLEQEGAAFKRKLENNAFLSRERAEQEQQRLLKQQDELNQLVQRLENEMMVEQQKMMLLMNDSINLFIQEYNKEKGYHIILNQASTLFINERYDITQDLIKRLNDRYKPATKK